MVFALLAITMHDVYSILIPCRDAGSCQTGVSLPHTIASQPQIAASAVQVALPVSGDVAWILDDECWHGQFRNYYPNMRGCCSSYCWIPDLDNITTRPLGHVVGG